MDTGTPHRKSIKLRRQNLQATEDESNESALDLRMKPEVGRDTQGIVAQLGLGLWGLSGSFMAALPYLLISWSTSATLPAAVLFRNSL